MKYIIGKRLILIKSAILSLIFVFFFSTDIKPRITITYEELQTSGVVRLSDLTEYLNLFAARSVNKYDSELLSAEDLTSSTSKWRIFINDLEYDLDFFGRKDINNLPLSVASIQQIEIDPFYNTINFITFTGNQEETNSSQNKISKNLNILKENEVSESPKKKLKIKNEINRIDNFVSDSLLVVKKTGNLHKEENNKSYGYTDKQKIQNTNAKSLKIDYKESRLKPKPETHLNDDSMNDSLLVNKAGKVNKKDNNQKYKFENKKTSQEKNVKPSKKNYQTDKTASRLIVNKDFNIIGMLTMGNETGDPGPYRYTEYTSPNVDRTGPDFILYMKNKCCGFINHEIDLSYGEHFATDPLTADRTKFLADDSFPRIRFFLGRYENNSKINGISINLISSIKLIEDFTYYEPFMKEIPDIKRFSDLFLSTVIPLWNKNNSLKFGFKYSERISYYRDNYYLSKFDISEESYSLKSSYLKNGQNFDFHISFDYFIEKLESFSSEHQKEKFEYEIGLSKDIFRLNLKLQKLYSKYYFQLLNEFSVRNMKFLFSYKEYNPVEISDYYWYFKENISFFFWEDVCLNYYLTDKTREFTFKNQITKKEILNSFDAGINTFISYYKGFPGEKKEYEEFDNYDGTAKLDLYPSDALKIGFRGNADYKISKNIFFSAYYSTYKMLKTHTDSIILENSKSIPKHQFQLNFMYKRFRKYSSAADFTGRFCLRYQSSSNRIYYTSSGKIDEKICGFWSFDAVLTKYFLNRNIKMNLILKNLLNEQYKTHPAGAGYDLYIHLTFSYVL